MINKKCGILMSISSLPSKYGIGTLGIEAYKYVDFLVAARQTYWQILPVGPTSYGDSPYQTFSAFAGNPYFIDIDFLINEGLLKIEDLAGFDLNFYQEVVDYAKVYNQRFDILKLAFNNFDLDSSDYTEFLVENAKWLDNYALFMSLKLKHNNVSWCEWEDCYKFRDENALSLYADSHKSEINFWKFLQFKFFEQWYKLKKYANEHDVKFIGDMAIYVAYDSCDVWVNPQDYLLDDNLNPTVVAGCPPDEFAVDGQLWGNPIYNWSYMDQTGYKFWVERTNVASQLYDITRIDHFRGFAGFYCIPFGDITAKNGYWDKGPGYKLFAKIKEELGDIPIIAEDLGFITEDVHELLDACGFPGMKLMMFGFGNGDDNEHLPHNYVENTICYAGTHDNSTINGWKTTISENELNHCLSYLDTDVDNIIWPMFEKLYASNADYAIVTMQDVLELDDKARFNIPSTLGGNWAWRMKPNAITDEMVDRLMKLAEKYNRV